MGTVPFQEGDHRVTLGRVLVIGLDGAAPGFVEYWAREGALPFLGDLARRGAFGTLRSTLPAYTPTAWTSIVTGVNPGSHGVFGFTRTDASGREAMVDSGTCRSKPVWEILSEQGIPSVVANVPITFPPRPFSGVLVSGMGTPPDSVRFAYPNEVQRLITNEFPGYVPDVAVPDRARASRRAALQILDDIERVTAMRLRLAERLMLTYPWRFGMLVLEAPDRVQHLWWKRIAPDAASSKEGEAVLDVYRRLDERLGRFVEVVESDGSLDVLIVSDHGFQALDWTLSLNNFLADAGLAVLSKGSLAARAARAAPDWMHAVARRVPRLRAIPSLSSRGGFDPDRTIAFTGSVFEQAVYIVPTGDAASYAVRRKSVEDALRALPGPDGRSRAVTRVWRREEIYRGPWTDEAPDLFPVFETSGVMIVPRTSTRRLWEPVHASHGTHHESGLVMAAGPHVAGGRRDGDAQDIAPTVLSLLGLPVPREMDGRPIAGIGPGTVALADVSLSRSDQDEGSGITPAEEEEIAARLQGLGYFE